tara:strand:+ start:691 stop:807 length:117 start_codon:yes stop_codon:yes gene_type:complete
MKKKESKNAAKILFTWRKAMPFYYAIAIGIVILIVVIK